MTAAKVTNGAITASVVGTPLLVKQLAAVEGRMRAALASGVYLGASNIMGQSKARVPHDLGALQASGYVTLPVEQGTQVLCELGYGGPAAAYAVRQHEEPTYQHDEGRVWKYLEHPVMEARGTFARFVGRIVARKLKDGGTAAAPTALGPTTPDAGGK